MKLFPETTYFFINIWTWGYEDILKAIAREFQSQVKLHYHDVSRLGLMVFPQIHVDRYKFSIFQRISDPFLRAITTRDPSTRFHACERFHRCEYVAMDNGPGEYSNAMSQMGKRVVYVNPVTMGNVSWTLYLQNMKERVLSGEVINNLVRHPIHVSRPSFLNYMYSSCPSLVILLSRNSETSWRFSAHGEWCPTLLTPGYRVLIGGQ